VALVHGGEGEVGEELEGVETYRFVGSVGAGGCRRGVAGGAGVGAAVSSRRRQCSDGLGGRGYWGRGLRASRRHKEPIPGVDFGGGMAEVGVHRGGVAAMAMVEAVAV